MFAGRRSTDFVDPAVDEMYVLVHDSGTADAQYLSLSTAVHRSEVGNVTAM